MSDETIRRDPRAGMQFDRARGVVRIDRIDRGVRQSAGWNITPPQPAAALQRDRDAGTVVCVPDLPDGRLSDHDRLALAAACELAQARSLGVAVVTFGTQDAGELGERGADCIIAFDAAEFASPELRAAAVRAIFDTLQPLHVVLPDSEFIGGETGRRLAASLGIVPNAAVAAFAGDRAISACSEPAMEIADELSRVVLVGSTFPHALRLVPGPALRRDAPAVVAAVAAEDQGLIHPDPATVPLDEAEFIVAGGAGVSDWDLFHRLVAALGASPAASRVVVDAGLMPHARQVGASGTIVAARCYLAIGISGAVQHLEGIAGCQHVISVNPDEACPMAARADLTVVGGAREVMTEMLKLCEQSR